MGGGNDVCNLILFGFLHCRGKKTEKNEILYALLHDGGPSRHPIIGHGNEDYANYLEKLMKFCTIDAAQLMLEAGVESVTGQMEEEESILNIL